MWYNPLVTWILRSPLHGLMSGNTLLITYTGRKSGKTFTFPISYGREGQTIWLMTRNDKPWIKNIPAEGLPVKVQVQGQELPARAEVVPLTQAEAIERMLFVYKGMPRSMAERQAGTLAVVKVSLIS
jgi:hypothetical protein